MKNKKLFIISSLLMIILGASDAMRGIFSPLFINQFGFSVAEVGIIVSVSYAGNFVCLLMGGVILDKIGKKKAFTIFISILALSELLLLLGKLYMIILIGFFLTLGISTLLNTAINLISDEFSTTKTLMLLNIIFFLQGIGTTLSQFILTRYSSSVEAWNITLIIYALLLSLTVLAFDRIQFGEKKEENEEDEDNEIDCKINKLPLILIALSLAFYLIAEHGVTNYIMIYGTEYLNLDKAYVGNALALYSAGIMLGRLLLGSVIDRLGTLRMLLICISIMALTLIGAFVFNVLYLVLLSGFACSIIYPTLVNLVKHFVPSQVEARTTTAVVSIASIFDISFNFGFGFIIAGAGYKMAMSLIPLSAIISLLFLFSIKYVRADVKTNSTLAG